MRCFPDLGLSSDMAFWVTREAFLKHFDQADFLCRKSEDVAPSFLAAWFHTPGDGTTRFLLPTVQFVTGKTQFINGRHRTAVLLPYLENLPIAFSLVNTPPQDFLRRVVFRSVVLHELIELPDLPILEHAP
jgi:hypothetical protein